MGKNLSRHDFADDIQAVQHIPEIEAMLAEVCALTDMGFAAVARVTGERWVACQVLDKVEFGLTPGDELEIQTTICNEIRQSGQGVFIDEVSADPHWRTHPIPMLYGFESYVSLPIMLQDGSFFGTMCVIDPKPRTGLAAALPRIRELAARIASELDRIKLVASR